MIRFEVTGATPEEFAENAVAAYGTLMVGLQACMTELSRLRAMVQPIAPETCGSESSSTVSKDPPPTLMADRADDLFVEKEASAPAPESSASAPRTRTSAAKTAAKSPKLDDLKTRLSEVIVAATERWDQKRANAYARQLIGRFGAKLSDLAPDQYEIFMRVSSEYLDGTAAE